MRYIDLHGSGGPKDATGVSNTAWLQAAQDLLQQLIDAPDQAARNVIIDTNDSTWKQLRDWLLQLSYDKCWYSESRDLFAVPEVEHYRPKKRCKRQPRTQFVDGYWWLAFDWHNYRMCGKVGNTRKQDFFPLATGSPIASHGGLSIHNEIPLLLDPACPGDPSLLSFDEDGQCVPHADAGEFARQRVLVTTARLNLNYGRLKEGRQRVWKQCRDLIEECRSIALQIDRAPGPADIARLNSKKEELRRMVQPDAQFSAVAKSCLLKSNIGWACQIATG